MWTTGLEATPKGTELGASSSGALRTIKSTFKDMISKEHLWSGDASPKMNHIAGDSTVCGLSSGTPTPLDVTGSIWWDYLNKDFYRDAGGGVGVGSPIVSFNHSLLSNLDSATAHTNYILVDGDTIQYVEIPKLIGLSTTLSDFSDNKYVLSQKAHLTTPSGHDAGVITSNLPNTAIGLDKLKTTETTLVDSDITGGLSGNLIMDRYSFVPYLCVGTTAGVWIGFELMAAYDTDPPEDGEVGAYAGAFRAYWVGIGGNLHAILKYQKVSTT